MSPPLQERCPSMSIAARKAAFDSASCRSGRGRHADSRVVPRTALKRRASARNSHRFGMAIPDTASWAAAWRPRSSRAQTMRPRWARSTISDSRSGKPISAYGSTNICASASTQAFSTRADRTSARTHCRYRKGDVMKGDFSRDTFERKKHYSAVLMQQGRVQDDADWNEGQSIAQYRNEVEATDVIGQSGAPRRDPGFKIS